MALHVAAMRGRASTGRVPGWPMLSCPATGTPSAVSGLPCGKNATVNPAADGSPAATGAPAIADAGCSVWQPKPEAAAACWQILKAASPASERPRCASAAAVLRLLLALEGDILQRDVAGGRGRVCGGHLHPVGLAWQQIASRSGDRLSANTVSEYTDHAALRRHAAVC